MFTSYWFAIYLPIFTANMISGKILVPILTTNVGGGPILCGSMRIISSRRSFWHIHLWNPSTGHIFTILVPILNTIFGHGTTLYSTMWIILLRLLLWYLELHQISANFDHHCDMWHNFMFHNINLNFKTIILTSWTPRSIDYLRFYSRVVNGENWSF